MTSRKLGIIEGPLGTDLEHVDVPTDVDDLASQTNEETTAVLAIDYGEEFEDEEMARVREILASPPSVDGFEDLMRIVVGFDGEARGGVFLEYVLEHLETWPDECRVLFPGLAPYALDPNVTIPGWVECIKTVSLNAVDDDELEVLAARFSHVTRLDLQNVHFENALLLENFKEVEFFSLSGCPSPLGMDSVLRTLPQLRELRLEHLIPLDDLNFVRDLPLLEVLECKRFFDLVDIRGLEGHQNLKEISFDGSNIIRDFSVLSTLPLLEKLDLSNRELSFLNGFPSLPNLKELKLWSIDDLGNCEEIQSFFPGLRVLGLRSCEVLTHCGGLDRLEFLEELDMSNCPSLSSLSGLEGCKVLKKLDLSHGVFLTQEEIQRLSSVVSLKDLDLGHTRVSDSSFLRRLVNLRALNLQNTHVGMLFFLSNTSLLEELNVTDCSFLSPPVFGASAPPRLRVLRVSQMPMWFGEDQPENTSLDFLHVNRDGNFSMEMVKNLKGLKYLEVVGRVNVMSLEGIGELQSLERLILNGSHVRDFDALGLLPNLRRLECSNASVADGTISFVPGEQLDHLNMSRCRFTDPDFLHPFLDACKNLRYLHVEGSSFLGNFPEKIDCDQLVTFYLSGCESEVRPQVEAMMKRIHPLCDMNVEFVEDVSLHQQAMDALSTGFGH